MTVNTERGTTMTESIRFEGFSLPVSDLERFVAFYRQFGFEVLIQNDQPRFALLGLGEGTIGLLEVNLSKWPKGQRGATHVELSTDDLDALFEQLETQGVHFSSPPRDLSFERQMFTNDPDGYRLEIAQGRRG